MELTGVSQRTPSPIAEPEKEAAVLAPIIEREGAYSILFTKRSEQLGDHPGQMSFPGGGHEPTDTDLKTTALREANEEIDLRPAEADVGRPLYEIWTCRRAKVRLL